MKLYHDFQSDELCSNKELMLERPALYLFFSSLVDLCMGYFLTMRGYVIYLMKVHPAVNESHINKAYFPHG